MDGYNSEVRERLSARDEDMNDTGLAEIVNGIKQGGGNPYTMSPLASKES